MKFLNTIMFLSFTILVVSCGDDEPAPDVEIRIKSIIVDTGQGQTSTFHFTYNSSNRLIELKEEAIGFRRYTFFTYTNNTVSKHEHWLVEGSDSTRQEVTDYVYNLQKISEVNTIWESEDRSEFRKYEDIASTEVIQRSDSIVFGSEKWIQIIEFNPNGHSGELTTYTDGIMNETLLFSRNIIYGKVSNPLLQWNIPISYNPHLIEPFAIQDDPLPDVFMTSQFLPTSWITTGDIYTIEEGPFFGYTFFNESSSQIETITRVENSVTISTSTFEWEDVPQ